MNHKVICAGHICLDITPVFTNQMAVEAVEDLLLPGSLTEVGAVDVHTGGSVANTGLAMSFLGNDVSLLGKIGDDAFGMIIERIVQQNGGSGLIVDSNGSTSYSVVLAIPGIDRMFLHHPGANDSFCSNDVPDTLLKDAELLHFGYPPLMKRFYEKNGEELIRLFTRCKENDVLTSLDMAGVDPNSDAGRIDWISYLKNVLPLVDYFVPSIEEIAFMMQMKETDKKAIADQLLSWGAGTVLIKCGTEGIYYSNGSMEGMQPCYPVDHVASATGAGDTSIAAFLTAQLEGLDLAKSASLAAMEGACCVTTYDALSGLKTLPELEVAIHAC